MYRVGIIGPESTGKSTLAHYLARRYEGVYVPEYARDYVARLAPAAYTYDDVCAIARYQIAQLEQIAQENTNAKYFFDTELIVTRVWFDYKYGAAPAWLLEAMQRYKMDVYLLLYPDLPWVADPVRENGGDDIRGELFLRYEQEIQALDVPYYIIRHVDS